MAAAACTVCADQRGSHALRRSQTGASTSGAYSQGKQPLSGAGVETALVDCAAMALPWCVLWVACEWDTDRYVSAAV